MIVVEGPDGAGKTTLIKEIQSQFPVTLMPKAVGTEAQALTDLRQWVAQDAERLNQGVVFDRHALISGPIYGPVLGGGTNDFMFRDFGWLLHVTHAFYTKKPVIIYCLPPRRVCVHDNVGCWPEHATFEQCNQIYDLYMAKAAADVAANRAYLYDYTHTPLQPLMGYINRNEMF